MPWTVDELDRVAPTLVGEGRPARLLDQLDELRGLRLDGHPWARLLVACVLWDAQPGSAEATAQAHTALRAFRRGRDAKGIGLACFVLGCWAATAGDLSAAGNWWDKARNLGNGDPGDGEPAETAVDPSCVLMLAHGCLGAYGQGRLRVAGAMAEEASVLAGLLGAPRGEATALVNVGFLGLWTGEFERALLALNAAEDAFTEVPDPFDRYESPLCFGARGVLWALRGDDEAAERDLNRAVLAAQEVREGWYEAIARSMRAEFTARHDPVRARRDAAWALAELRRRNETWWRSWASHAAAIAAREAGRGAAAEVALRRVVAETKAPLEKARALLALGETVLAAGGTREAAEPLAEAAAILGPAGARYWAARCYTGLAAAEPENADRWTRMATEGDVSDPAFDRLFVESAQLSLLAHGPGEVRQAGRTVEFRTQHACQAVFILALAAPETVHVERLAEALWPGTRCEHGRLLARVRTLLWQVREGLGPHAWRLRRIGPMIGLDLAGAVLDVHRSRVAARRALDIADRPPAKELADRLRGPLLTRWAHQDWVLAEVERNDSLADQLTLWAAHLRFDGR